MDLFRFCVAFALIWAFVVADASEGDADPLYRTCVEHCKSNDGSVGSNFIQHCQLPSDIGLANGSWYSQELLYIQWKELNCQSDCQYHCMIQREKQREGLGLKPVKYNGKWPFKRVSVFQEPVSAILSALTLIVQFHGWLAFFLLVNYRLPLRPESGHSYYEFTGLWHIFGLLSMNAWFWSAIFHTRNFDVTEKLDYSSTVALIGYSLILSLLRVLDIKKEATRVMAAAPFLAFITTQIMYLNFYGLDYGLNMKISSVIGVAQLVLWAVWATLTHHPSRSKIWTVVIGTALSILLVTYDAPPYEGYIDYHSILHATAIPLSYLWWSFIKQDAEFRTRAIIEKSDDKAKKQ